jgi:transposase
MRGRWASAALGAGLARRQASYEMDQQAQAYESQLQQSQQQIEAQKRQIEALQRQSQQQKHNPQPKHEDLTEKIKNMLISNSREY